MPDEWKLPPFSVEEQFIAQSEIVDWGVSDLGLADLWPEFGMGENSIGAVLDTGQPTHKDLIPCMGPAKDFTGSVNNVRDVQGHSTHVCGTIAAQHNEVGTRGIAPKTTLLCGKVLGDNGSGSHASVAAGIRWAKDQNADVINMSLGSPSPSPMILEAINSLPPEIILVCAAGNSGPGQTLEFPAAWERPMSVAATTQQRQVAPFSTRNEEVDVAAPGSRITSTWLNDQVATLNGTSMATPHVAGIALMAKGYCRRFGYVLTHATFWKLITETADDIGPVGPDIASGFGIVNPRKFFARLKTMMPAPVPHPPAVGTPWSVTIIGVGEMPSVTGPVPG